MDKVEKALNELKKGIIGYVQNIIDNAPFDKVVVGTIKSVSGTKCTVTINRKDYTDIPKLSHLTLTSGEVVKIMIPQNNYNNMFILGKLG